MKKIGSWIDHQLTTEGDITTPVYQPATGETVALVHHASTQAVNNAIQSAQRAFQTWSMMTPLKRARVFFAYKNLLEANRDQLTILISQEHGKTLADAAGEVTRGLEVVEFVCGMPHLQKGYYSENVGQAVDSYALRQPLGVCVGITPFNFPAMIPLWMFPVAIACGNSFILKPSEKTPSAALLLAELLAEAGLPKGVLQVLQGGQAVVEQLLTHPAVQAVSFVGSTPVAKAVYTAGCNHLKRVQALGGAKNHAVVMPDADLTQAANAIIGGAFGSAGERCMALPTVVAVGEKTADRLREILIEKIQAIRVGPGDAPDTDMGPLITADHLDQVRQHVTAGIDDGAELVIDGRDMPAHLSQGYFMGPCLFDHVTPEMSIQQTEIFGPVLNIMRAPDFETALGWVDEHPFGNGTALFTTQGAVAQEFAKRVQVGMVGVNVPIPVPMAYHSFGGWKQSLFGQSPMHGPSGVDFYTRQKNVTVRWPAMQHMDFQMPTSQ